MIESVIQNVIASHSPSSGENLLGFEYDADHYFGLNEIFANAKVVSHDNPLCMLELRGQILEQISTIQHLHTKLDEIWQKLAYSHFQATSLKFFREATVLRFVTLISNDGFYVTGKMIAGGGHYPQLVEQYEKDFGRTLPSSPLYFNLDSLWT